MKKTLLLRLFLLFAIIPALSTLTSCTKKYVVNPEDIQAYLDKGADLTITLPANSSFDLVNVNGQRLVPGNEVLESTPDPKSVPPDTSGNNNGANGEKKFRHAGAFIKEAYAGPGAYRCPDVCAIIIKTPL